MSVPLLLPLTALIGISSALPWPGPQQTDVATSTANWSPAPTSHASKDESFLELIRRDIFPVSICGWIGGTVTMPAYCSTESSCVWNSDISIVGCCATASSACKFYTSCLDLNSPEPTADSDDVFTCKGFSVCYSNRYPGNYIQWGCGSSEWATTVATSYSGMEEDLSLQVVITGSGSSTSSSSSSSTSSSQSAPSSSSSSATQIITSSSSNSQPTTSSSSSQPTSDSSSPSSTIPTPPTATQSSTPSPVPIKHKSSSRTGPIAGGVLGGAALICFLAGLFLFGHRRGWFQKKQNEQEYQSANNQETTAYLDSNPVFEMGASENGDKGKASRPWDGDSRTPISTPSQGQPGPATKAEIKEERRISELP